MINRTRAGRTWIYRILRNFGVEMEERERERDELENEREDRFVEETSEIAWKGNVGRTCTVARFNLHFPASPGIPFNSKSLPLSLLFEKKKKRRRERKKKRNKKIFGIKKEGVCAFSGGINRGGSDATTTRWINLLHVDEAREGRFTKVHVFHGIGFLPGRAITRADMRSTFEEKVQTILEGGWKDLREEGRRGIATGREANRCERYICRVVIMLRGLHVFPCINRLDDKWARNSR